jgi:PAS domain S-box-containing protein
MLMVDEAGRILLVNAQIEAQFGYSRQELLGQPVEILLPQALRARHREHRAGFFSHPEPRRMGEGRDLFGLRKDGKEICVEIGLNPIQTPQGLRVLASVVDITARKQMEAQLLRTERLAELGTLASGMAHEIGTPMNVILGRAEYLMQRTKEETTKKGLETIVSQVERITKIMNQLLSFARRRPIERRSVDLRQTVEDTLEVVQERLGRHHIKLETDFAADLPLVYADPDQMSQVLLNLILNAIHAMADEGTLRLGLVRAANTVRLTIADTGHGIKAEDLAKIFDPFFTTKEVGKGTGLGLTVVHGIIEEHGGTIAVTSEVGRGTTFIVTLPISS